MTSIEQLDAMGYVDFMANINETNRCPWWKDAIRQMALNTFLTPWSKVLDVWCNTWYVSFELARLVKCKVTGLDINENMIRQSSENNTDKAIAWLVNFVVGNGESLLFGEWEFDLVTSWWSTIFMENIEKWLQEYKRVCKDWWFVADINFFYTNEIPYDTISQINTLLGINIQPRKIDYFLNLYEKVWLEKYYIYTAETYKPDSDMLEKYCRQIIAESVYHTYGAELEELAYKKLHQYMSVFYDNNKYLSYWVFIYRKRPDIYKEQISLFGY